MKIHNIEFGDGKKKKKSLHYDKWQWIISKGATTGLMGGENMDKTIRVREWTQKPHYLQQENNNKYNV